MRALVTGGHGFLGLHVVQKLQKEGHTVTILSHTARAKGEFAADIAQHGALAKVFARVKPEWVFHLAADTERGGGENLGALFDTNVLGTHNLLVASRAARVKAFIAAGTLAEYGDAPTPFREDGPVRPLSPYGISKAAASLLASSDGRDLLPAAVLRFPILYGRGVSTFCLQALVQAIARGKPMTLISGKQKRDFLPVQDAADAFVLAAEHISRSRGESINIASGEEHSLRSVVALAEKITGTSNLAKIVDHKKGEREQLSYMGDIRKAKRLLGWSPSISFEKGLREFLTTEHT